MGRGIRLTFGIRLFLIQENFGQTQKLCQNMGLQFGFSDEF